MPVTFLSDMCQCFTDNFIHKLYGHIKIHSSFFYSCNGKQIFHNTNEPLGIIKNFPKYLLSHISIQCFIVHKYILRIPGNCRKRCTQVMGNGT